MPINKVTPEQKNKIKILFNKISSIDDFLSLINKVNKVQYQEYKKLELKQLTYYAFINKSKYTIFEIKKKSGGTREIYSPKAGLKYILSAINIILQSVYKPTIATHGFINYRSIVTNAKNHTDKIYVYNIDLENFFPSIHQARVWKKLQLPPFNLCENKIQISELIANLVCYQYSEKTIEKNFLPQGAPTSPIISNIICERLDRRLLGLAKRFNLKYTRYADDITFSSNHNVYQEDSDFIKELNSIISKENFKINSKKTRLQKKEYKQEVTGIIVNKKTNVPKKFIKELRTQIYLLEEYGIKKSKSIYKEYYKKINGDIELIPNMINVIYGKLKYLKMVKGQNDSTYLKLNNRFENCFKTKKHFASQNFTSYELKEFLNHQPQKMVELLKKFTSEEPLKSSTHPTKNNECYLDFIKELRVKWEIYEEEYKDFINEKLKSKIYTFLCNSNPKNGWGIDNIKIGWASSKLKKWCEENPNLTPNKFPIENTIYTFQDIINYFKMEIEITPNRNNLYSFLFDIMDNELCEFEKLTDEETEEILDEAKFFIDTQWIKEGLELIFNEINQRSSVSKRIRIQAKKNKEFIELKIIHINSFSKFSPEKLLERLENGVGSFPYIQQKFTSLCDVALQSKYHSSVFRINILNNYNNEEKLIKDINTEEEGFTYIFRFYR